MSITAISSLTQDAISVDPAEYSCDFGKTVYKIMWLFGELIVNFFIDFCRCSDEVDAFKARIAVAKDLEQLMIVQEMIEFKLSHKDMTKHQLRRMSSLARDCLSSSSFTYPYAKADISAHQIMQLYLVRNENIGDLSARNFMVKYPTSKRVLRALQDLNRNL
ncbi:MAG: hypothetical protein FJZ56_06860 [Chlamydiae bacterium]|nr:hypothetical protein [Chlamydiota bacterium]